MTVCDDRCRDEEMHAFYVAGAGFRWTWPTFDVLGMAASKRTRLVLNRYPHNVIGVAVYLRGHGFGVRWKQSNVRMRWFEYVRSFYDTNRDVWSDLGRVRSLISAWKCWRMVRHAK